MLQKFQKLFQHVDMDICQSVSDIIFLCTSRKIQSSLGGLSKCWLLWVSFIIFTGPSLNLGSLEQHAAKSINKCRRWGHVMNWSLNYCLVHMLSSNWTQNLQDWIKCWQKCISQLPFESTRVDSVWFFSWTWKTCRELNGFIDGINQGLLQGTSMQCGHSSLQGS